jgi:RNA-binding protein YhbY
MDQVDELVLNPSWMEDVDACLWQKELVQLRLGNAVAKKKGAKLLGERIAKDLDAHVAQVVGHTVLLYRPGIPPVLNLEELSEQRSAGKNGD